MKQGIKIEFADTETPAEINFNATIDGFAAVAQNGMVNLATRQGSDSIDNTRGTNLFESATVGSLIDEGEQQHATALAAERTRLFMRVREDLEKIEDPKLKINEVGLEVSDVDLNRIVFNAYFINVNGNVIGSPLVEII